MGDVGEVQAGVQERRVGVLQREPAVDQLRCGRADCGGPLRLRRGRHGCCSSGQGGERGDQPAGVPEHGRGRRTRGRAVRGTASWPSRRSSHRAAAPRGAAPARADPVLGRGDAEPGAADSPGHRRRRRVGSAKPSSTRAGPRHGKDLFGDARRPAGSPRRRSPATAGRARPVPATSPAWVPPEPVATHDRPAAIPALVALLGRTRARRRRSRWHRPGSPRRAGTPYGRRPSRPQRSRVRRRRRRRARRASRPRRTLSRAPAARGQLDVRLTGRGGAGPGEQQVAVQADDSRRPTAAAAQKFEVGLPAATKTSAALGERRRRAGTPAPAPCCRPPRTR